MKKLRSALSLALALLMLFACIPGAFAVGTDSAPQQQEKTPAQDENLIEITEITEFPPTQKGDVYSDPLALISLTDAANPAYALRVVDVTTENNEWSVAYDEDMERYVASASISTAAGSYTRTLSTQTFEYNFTDAYPVMFLRAYIGLGGNISIVCVDEDTGNTWVPYYYSVSADEYDQWVQRGVDLKYNAPSSGLIRFHVLISYSYSISKGGGTEYPCCKITNLQVSNGYSADEMGNAPDSDLKIVQFVYYSSAVSTSLLDGTDDHGFIYMRGNSDDESISGFYAHVTAAQGDVLSFDYISSLDYMAGSQFRFGTATGQSLGNFQALFEGENESGEGYYSSSGQSDWANWSYTIPSNGEYDFVWMLDSFDEGGSELYVSNIRLTPRMSPERALNDFGSDGTYHNGDDTPWVPCYFMNEFCMKSGPITHNGTSTLITEGNLLKTDDLFQFRIWCSSEEGCDFFRAYMLNTSDPNAVEELVYEDSGQYTGWIAAGVWIETPGVYTFRFEYSKDYSVSDYDDCAYLDFVDCTNMTQTHAVCAADEDEEVITAWDYYPENFYRFVPVLFDGEVVLASDNQGVHNSSAYLNIDVELEAYETFTFDYIKDAEANYDNLTIYLNSAEYAVIKPRSTTWQEFSYTTAAAGTYRFELVFHKDVSVNTGTDTVYLRNARVIPDGLNEALQENYQGNDYLHHTSEFAWFTPMEVDDRYAVGIEMDDPDNEAEAGVSFSEMMYGFQYITFEYKLLGDAAVSLYLNNEYYSDFDPEVDGEWHRFYYRVPQTGQMDFFLNALVNPESAVYLDNFHIGYLETDIEQGLDETGGGDYEIHVTDSQGFTGISDPLFYRDAYAAGRIAAGGTCVLEWDQYYAAGDAAIIHFAFLDEDEQANGSSFELVIDGTSLAEIYDSGMNPNRFYYFSGLLMPYTGVHHIEVIYHSNASAYGDALAVICNGPVEAGATLDEALNVTGGTLHFEVEEDWGTLVPRVNGDRCFGLPVAKRYPVEDMAYEWSFETADELDGWIFIDSDGDGYNWERFNANNNTVCVDAASGEYVLKSASYEPGVYGLTPDNWALSPEVTLPEDSKDSELLFRFSGCNEGWYKEHFAVYIGTGTDVSTYEMLYETTIDQPDWNSIATSLDSYAGQTVRIAIRHFDSPDVYWLFIDDFMIKTFPVYSAEVSVDVNVQYGDMLCYELLLTDDDVSIYNSTYIEVYSERMGRLTIMHAATLYNNYGAGEWIPCCITLPYSGEDTITYRFIQYNANDYDAGFRIMEVCLDNVEIVSEEIGLFGDVNCDGEVTFSDVSALYSYLIGGSPLTAQGLINADVNGDGEVTFADVSALYSYIIGGA